MKDEILKRLDLLAAKLNTTTQYLWGVLVHQAKVEAYTDLIQLGLYLIGAVGGVWAAIILVKLALDKDEEGSDMAPVYGIGSFLSVALGIVCTVMFLVGLTSWVTPLFNPEYWALQQIMGLIGK